VTPDDFAITEAMIMYGGSFAQQLGKAWRCADETNQQRLKAAFGDCWEKYRELAKLKAQRA